MGIYFGSSNAFVAKHFLYSTQIGTPFHQVGSKGMAECMRMNIFLDTHFGGEVFEDVENHNSRECGTSAVQKNMILEARFGIYFISIAISI